MTNSDRPFRGLRVIGLTGGVGAGKSEVARRFAERGIPVIEADKLGHELLLPGGAAEQEIIESFGIDILSCGKIDRVKLGNCVFGNPAALEKLNRITHPRLKARLFDLCRELDSQGHRFAVVEAAIMGDDGVVDPWVFGVLLVVANPEIRLARLCASRGWTEEQARARIAAQVDPETKRAFARWVIENNGDTQTLDRQVNQILKDMGVDEAPIHIEKGDDSQWRVSL